MATSKHVVDASLKISEYIVGLPDWSRSICEHLREIILKSDVKLIEDWKWGPNYYHQGMVCGYAAFQKHVNLVFFQGTLLADEKKILQSNPGNLHNRHIKFTDIKQIDEDLLLEYLIEAIDNNKTGKKLIKAADKTVVLASDIHSAFQSSGVLNYFETLAYSHRKEYIYWIEEAKNAPIPIKVLL